MGWGRRLTSAVGVTRLCPVWRNHGGLHHL